MSTFANEACFCVFDCASPGTHPPTTRAIPKLGQKIVRRQFINTEQDNMFQQSGKSSLSGETKRLINGLLERYRRDVVCIGHLYFCSTGLSIDSSSRVGILTRLCAGVVPFSRPHPLSRSRVDGVLRTEGKMLRAATPPGSFGLRCTQPLQRGLNVSVTKSHYKGWRYRNHRDLRSARRPDATRSSRKGDY